MKMSPWPSHKPKRTKNCWVGQGDHFSTKKNATSVSIILWIKDLILIGIYGQIDRFVLFRNVSKTPGDVENSGDGMDGMEVWKIRRMPMSLAPWGNLSVGPLDRWMNVTTGSFQKRQQKHTDCSTWKLKIMISKGISWFQAAILRFHVKLWEGMWSTF